MILHIPNVTRLDTGAIRRRILDGAIALFNRNGLVSVSIEQICAHLQISKDSLLAQFKHKDALALATVQRLKEQIHMALHRPDAVVTPMQTVQYLECIYQTFWNFRFYFKAMEGHPCGETLHAEYPAIRRSIIDSIEGAIACMAARDVFRAAVPPNSHRMLAENIWSLLLLWLLQQDSHPQARHNLSLRQWSLCQPWMEPQFAQSLLTAIQSLPADTPVA